MKGKQKGFLQKIGNILPKNWPVIVIIGIVLLILLILLLPRLLPNNNPADLNAYYGVQEGERIVFINTEQADIRVLEEEGELYLPLSAVIRQLNQRFYEDPESGTILYALPDRMDELTPEKRVYTEGGVTTAAGNAAPYIIRDGEGYLSMEIISRYTRLQYQLLEAPDRLCIWTVFDTDVPYLYAEKDVFLRTGPGYAHPVISEQDEGASMILVSEENGWMRVFSRDGHIGYVPAKTAGNPVTIQTSGAFFREQEYGTDQIGKKVSLGFDYIDDVSYGLDMLRLHLENREAVNVVCPTWFTLQGNKGEFTSCGDPEYVKLAHKNRMQVWGMIENINGKCDGLALFSSRKARENLIQNLLSAVSELDLDGINLDIESLNEEIVPHYLQFIRELSMALNGSGIVLSVDTYAPYPWNLKYDLPELAKLLDYVVIMAYDQSWDTPGPNSEKSFVKFCCEKSLEVTPAEKLVIAIPFYARGWSEKEDGSWSRMELSMKKCVEYLRICTDKEWLEEEGCWHGHAEIDDIRREVWFENPESTEERIALIAEYGPAGLAYWRLSQEDNSVWNSVRLHGFYE